MGVSSDSQRPCLWFLKMSFESDFGCYYCSYPVFTFLFKPLLEPVNLFPQYVDPLCDLGRRQLLLLIVTGAKRRTPSATGDKNTPSSEKKKFLIVSMFKWCFLYTRLRLNISAWKLRCYVERLFRRLIKTRRGTLLLLTAPFPTCFYITKKTCQVFT